MRTIFDGVALRQFVRCSDAVVTEFESVAVAFRAIKAADLFNGPTILDRNRRTPAVQIPTIIAVIPGATTPEHVAFACALL